MLKLLTPSNIFTDTQTKCGEIYYQNLNDFTIICTICQMKSFHFEDFLQHVRINHLENDLNQPEASEPRLLNECLQITDTNEAELCEIENCTEIDYLQDNLENESALPETLDILENCIEQSSDISELDVESNSNDENGLILKKPEQNVKLKRTKRCNSESWDENNDASANESEILSSHRKNENTKSKKSNKPQEYSCPECQQIFIYKKYMDNHVIEFHKGYKCSLCDARFQHRFHLQRHELKHNPEYKFSCPIQECSKIYNDRDNLKRHMLTHNPEDSYPCPVPNCKRIYSDPENLKRHELTHNPENNFTCPIAECNKKYANRIYLERHLEKHTSQTYVNVRTHNNKKIKKFVCDICGYRCCSEAELTIHQRRHTGEKPFRCEFCEKGFVSKTALNTHMAKHSNTRPHVCEICDASFLRSDILRRHMLIHSEEKRFKCYFCDKAFKQPQGLDGHMRRLHKDPKAKTDGKLSFFISQ